MAGLIEMGTEKRSYAKADFSTHRDAIDSRDIDMRGPGKYWNGERAGPYGG